MKRVLWALILAAIAYAIYLGDKEKIVVKFLPERTSVESKPNETDTGIHDAVNFVKPL